MNGINKIPKEKINEIKNSVDIVDVISSYIPLTTSGKNYFGVCPFHDDTNPSMSVSREKQIYTCFSCGASGTVFNFIMDYENVNFIQALKMCADIGGIDLNINSIKIKDDTKYKELYDMYEIACKLYQNNINTQYGSLAKKYLLDRKIDQKIIKDFKIGLALNNYDLLAKLLIKKGYNEPFLTDSGLVVKKNLDYYDSFFDRIIFPIEDVNGKIVGFSGRIYKDDPNKKEAKYKNTKETKIFKKGQVLYNYRIAKEEARKEGYVIIMEGFMDLFRAYQIGVKNVVISMGTAVTKEQASLLKRMAKDIILCFDGDSAGEKASYACANELLELGITPKIVRLEENLDPDEYILKYGKEKFLEKIKNPLNIMEFKLNYLKNNKNLDSEIDMSKYINEVLDEVKKIDDDILLELTLRKLSNETKLDIDFLKSKLNKKEKNKNEQKTKVEKKNNNMYIKAEQNLLYYMLISTEVIKMYQKKVAYMPTDNYRKLAREINYFYKENGYINVSDLMIVLNDNIELLNTIKEINMLNLKENYTVEEIEDYIKIIKQFNIEDESKRLKELMIMEIDPVKKAEIAQKILEIKKLENEIGEDE